MVCSMSRKNDCNDNAIVESIFHSLKVELISDTLYQTRDKDKLDVVKYIEMFYNSQRMDSFLDYKSLNDFERDFHLANPA
jgi:putative transposase